MDTTMKRSSGIKPKARMRLFIIRLKPEWVEVRASRRRITGLQSSITRQVSMSYGERFASPFHDATKDGLRKAKLTQTVWSGGRSLGVFPVGPFEYRTNLGVPALGRAREVKLKRLLSRSFRESIR